MDSRSRVEVECTQANVWGGPFSQQVWLKSWCICVLYGVGLVWGWMLHICLLIDVWAHQRNYSSLDSKDLVCVLLTVHELVDV